MVLLHPPEPTGPMITDVFPQILCVLPKWLTAMHQKTAQETGVVITIMAECVQGIIEVQTPLGRIPVREGYCLFSMTATVPMPRTAPKRPQLFVVKRFS